MKRWIKIPDTVIAQTEVAKQRLLQSFPIRNIKVVPNAVSLENLRGGSNKDFHLPKDKINLLYLTKYYSHKNIEILLPLAREIATHQLHFCIVITISSDQGEGARKVLQKIKEEKLDDIIINVGPVDMKNVPSLYEQSNALLMPTLLESFSGTYIEALFHSKPIFTSDFDFAHEICGDAAFYFDPFDAASILQTINVAFNNPDLIKHKMDMGKERLKVFPTWSEVFSKFSEIIQKS